MTSRIVSKSLFVAAVVLWCATAAAAPVNLRFSPADTTVAPGTAGHLSIMLTDAVAVRTVDIYVTYDTTTVTPVDGGAGALYTNSGLQLFQGYEIEEPGRWRGYVVVMAAAPVSVTGPGELFRWNFTGQAIGVTDIVAVEAYLIDAAGAPLAELAFLPTTVRVGDDASGIAPGVPSAVPRLTPNPFNPRTEFALDLPTAGPLLVDVLDIRGRWVAVLFDGRAPDGTFRATWDGRDGGGREVPGGVYLFRYRTAGSTGATKGLLLK